MSLEFSGAQDEGVDRQAADDDFEQCSGEHFRDTPYGIGALCQFLALRGESPALAG
jgi:hypothetical protein